MHLLRRALFALVLAFTLTGQAFAAEFQDFTPQAFAAAQTRGEPTLVVVAADWCPTCRAQEAAIHDMARDHAFDQLIVFRVDYDHQRDAWRALGVRERSTLIAFHGARETGRLLGATDPQTIRALMRTSFQ